MQFWAKRQPDDIYIYGLANHIYKLMCWTETPFFFEDKRTSELRCPFVAHIKKANPKDDFEVPPSPTAPISVQLRRIMRDAEFNLDRSWHTEKASGRTEHSRGLLFTAALPVDSSSSNTVKVRLSWFWLERLARENNVKISPYHWRSRSAVCDKNLLVNLFHIAMNSLTQGLWSSLVWRRWWTPSAKSLKPVK